ASKASDDPPPKPPRPEVAPTVPPVQDEYDDAPPSYEDAMADALGPVDGPRREYNPPEPGSWAGADNKGSAKNHKDDERLFPNSDPRNASTESFFDSYHANATSLDGHGASRLAQSTSAGQVQQTQVVWETPYPAQQLLQLPKSPQSPQSPQSPHSPHSPQSPQSPQAPQSPQTPQATQSPQARQEQPQRRPMPFMGVPSRKPVPGAGKQ
ncbi:hypothetical protein I7I51_04151, partial [Histoplasma capsulatum]